VLRLGLQLIASDGQFSRIRLLDKVHDFAHEYSPSLCGGTPRLHWINLEPTVHNGATCEVLKFDQDGTAI
jgi:hypothetical protein